MNMKTHFAIWTICLFELLMSACSKNALPIPPGGDSPQFYFHGTIGSDSVHWQAGENNLYMYTDFFLDPQRLIVLRGQLALNNCTTCEPSLSVEFRDVAPAPDSMLRMNINAFFTNHNIGSFSLDSTKAQGDKEEFSFHTLTQQNGNNFLWDFGDGTQSTEDDPHHIFTGNGTRNVKLIVNQFGNKDSLEFPINIGFQSPERIMFNYTQNANNEIQAQVSPSIFTQFLWDAGDGQLPTGNPINFTYQTPGIYTLSCLASAGVQQAIYKVKIKVPQGGNWPNPSFTYTTKIIEDSSASPRTNAGTVVLELKKDGKKYRSFKTNPTLNQSGITVVQAKSVSTFEPNTNGHPTLSVDLAVDTWLYNVQNQSDSIHIQSNKMRYAVAYPK